MLRRPLVVVAVCAAVGLAWVGLAVVLLPRLVSGGQLSVRDAVLVTGMVLALVVAVAAVLVRAVWRDRVHETLQREARATTNLQEAARLRSAFLAGVSHELRTPLTNIVGFARTIEVRRGDLPAPLLHQITERLVENASRLERMVLDLLDLDRPAVQPTGPQHHRRLDDIVASATEGFGADLALDVQASDVVVEVDTAVVRRIAVELLSNVRRHTPAGTRARLQAEVTCADRLRLVVEDDGPGIEPDRVEAVLEPFVQGAQASDDASPGLGIGFALVDRYTTALGGSWEITTPRDGGTRITVEVPVVVPVRRLDHAV